MRVISYGGGVQSTAMLVLAGTGRLAADVALFSNVGDDSEHPATLRYVREVANPWAAEHGVPVHELSRVKRDGSTETLYQRITKPDSRSLDIPVRMTNGAPGNRRCTADFKIKVIHRWCRDNGSSRANPHTTLIGISTDEFHRAKRRTADEGELVEYPLLDLGLSRSDCEAVIAEAGLPVPPKSSCYFCPFHSPQTWAEMRRDEPELFWQSVELERTLNTRRERLGKDHVYLTRFARPLDEAIGEAQTPLFDARDGWGQTCDEGVCFV